jgi:small subunit ribosomal protein S13
MCVRVKSSNKERWSGKEQTGVRDKLHTAGGSAEKAGAGAWTRRLGTSVATAPSPTFDQRRRRRRLSSTLRRLLPHSVTMVVSSHPARLLPLYIWTLTLPQLVFGVNFAESRLVKSALESFYGVGPQISQRLMARLSIHNTAKLQGLGHRTVNNLSAELQNLTIENNLRRKLQDNIKRLRDMGTYRGRRHAMSLPVRGQKTRTQVGPHYTSSASPKLTPCSGCNCQKVEQSSSQRLSLSPFLLLYKYSHNCIGWRNWFAIPKFSFLCILKIPILSSIPCETVPNSPRNQRLLSCRAKK